MRISLIFCLFIGASAFRRVTRVKDVETSRNGITNIDYSTDVTLIYFFYCSSSFLLAVSAALLTYVYWKFRAKPTGPRVKYWTKAKRARIIRNPRREGILRRAYFRMDRKRTNVKEKEKEKSKNSDSKNHGALYIPRALNSTAFADPLKENRVNLTNVVYNKKDNEVFEIGSKRDEIEVEAGTCSTVNKSKTVAPKIKEGKKK